MRIEELSLKEKFILFNNSKKRPSDTNHSGGYLTKFANLYTSGSEELLSDYLKKLGVNDLKIEDIFDTEYSDEQLSNFKAVAQRVSLNYDSTWGNVKGLLQKCWDYVEVPIINSLSEGIARIWETLFIKYPHSYTASRIDINKVCPNLIDGLNPYVKFSLLRILILEHHIYCESEKIKIDFQTFLINLSEEESQLLLNDYPCLQQIIGTQIEDWIGNCIELIERFLNDFDSLKDGFVENTTSFILANIDFGKGDVHNNGKSVAILTLSNGIKIVYKPRTAKNDLIIYDFLRFFTEENPDINFYCPKILDRSKYSWQEFILNEQCASIEDVEFFYKIYGIYSVIFYFFNVTDQHYGNLIAHNKYPVFVDFETIFQNTPKLASSDFNKVSRETVNEGILKSGLFPINLSEKPGEIIDISAYSKGEEYSTPVKNLELSFDTEGMVEMKRIDKFLNVENKNIPTLLNGNTIKNTDFIEQVVQGYKLCYDFFIRKNKEIVDWIKSIDNTEFRVVLRHTYYYNLIIEESLHPNNLQDVADRDIFFSVLMNDTVRLPYLSDLVVSEKKQMDRLNVPIFFSDLDSLSIRSGEEIIANYFFERSSREILIDKIRGASIENKDKHLNILAMSISTIADPPKNDLSRLNGDSNLRLNEVELHKAIENSLHHLKDKLVNLGTTYNGLINWPTIKNVNDNYSSLYSCDIDLYKGLSGILHFFNYYNQIYPSKSIEDILESIINTIHQRIDQNNNLSTYGTGAYTGLGGIIFALAQLPIKNTNATILKIVDKIINALPSMIEEDVVNDVIGGNAGLIISLSGTNQILDSKIIKKLIELAANRIIKNKSIFLDNLVGWGDRILTGFSHGNAGISYALIIAHSITRNEEFLIVANEAMNTESYFYSEEKMNWPDFRETPFNPEVKADFKYMNSWCHGAPGIGIGRAMTDKIFSNKYQSVMSKNITDSLLNIPIIDHSFCLCHGYFGNLDALQVTINEIDFKNTLYYDKLRFILPLLELTEQEYKHPQLLCPDMMTGISGIAYQLLRLLNPNIVPSILVLETKKQQ